MGPLPGAWNVTRHRCRLIAIVVAALAAHAGFVRGEVEELTLFQRTGRAVLVVRARALSDATRRPQVLVLETLKGSYPERTRLTLVPHAEDNTRPTPWLHREVFRKGEESVLFLEPYVDDFGRAGDSHTFKVMGASQGKLDLPPEGADALLNAVRRFAGVQALGQMEAQARALRSMLREKNPFLLEAALSECRRFHMGEPQDAPDLIPLVEHARPDLRAGALALLTQILQGADLFAAPEFPRQRVFEAVAARARLDDDARVRSAAVKTLASFGDEAALALLENIGAADASQQVRYEALVAARRLREDAQH
jgi:hypothetical protein